MDRVVKRSIWEKFLHGRCLENLLSLDISTTYPNFYILTIYKMGKFGQIWLNLPKYEEKFFNLWIHLLRKENR